MKSDYVLEADVQTNPNFSEEYQQNASRVYAMQSMPPDYQDRLVQVNKAENGYVITASINGMKNGRHYHKTAMWIANSEPFIGDQVKAAYEWDPQ